MPTSPIGYWRTDGIEPPPLHSGRHHLTREQVHASQRGRIMRAALHELGLHGAGSMTVSSVVEQAKVSRKTLYEHFDGVNDCLSEAIQTLNVVAGGEMARAASEADLSQPFAQLRAVVQELLDSASEEPILTSALLAPGFGLEKPDSQAWLLYGEIRAKMLMAWYESERARTPDLPETTFEHASAAFAAFEYAILRALAAGKQAELPGRSDEIIRLITGILSGGKAGQIPE